MGVTAMLYLVTPAELELFRDPRRAARVAEERLKDDMAIPAELLREVAVDVVDIDKAWTGLHVLLNECDLYEGAGPLAWLSNQTGQESLDLGRGREFVIALSPPQVAAAAAALDRIDDAEVERRARARPDLLADALGTDDLDEDLPYVLENLRALRPALAGAAAAGNAAIYEVEA